MCCKFVLVSNLQTIETRFNVRFGQNQEEIPKSFAVSGGQNACVITSEHPNTLVVFTFGMTPYFVSKPMNLLTARVEGNKNCKDDPCYNGSKSIFLQAAFKKPIQSQRCIVIADAYYEWSASNRPYLVFLQNKNRPFGFAAIYDQWQNPETKEITTSFAIITTTSNSMLQGIGVKRMPVILSKSDENEWVNPSSRLSDVLRFLVPYPSEKMNAYPVSHLVNEPEMNHPDMLNPTGEKLRQEAVSTPAKQGYQVHKTKSKQETPWFNPSTDPKSPKPE